MSLVLLATTHRVAPGLLAWRAWAVAREGRVLTGTADHPQIPYLGSAGVEVEAVEPDARAVVALARREDVVWLAAPDGDADFATRVGELVVADPLDVEVVHGSYDLPGARLLDVVEVMRRLRRDCPWDRQQTHESLVPYLIEETYELVDAIGSGDPDELREELGDVLFQVAFHSAVAAEREEGFTIDDVAAGIVDKLVRRHPHVFADVRVEGAEEVVANWDEIKKAEKAGRPLLGGVPRSMPALGEADDLVRKARKAGVPEALFAGFQERAEAARRAEAELKAWSGEFRSLVEAWEARSRG
ncbi:MazG family protein [Actinocorallia sp. A-T 12471]|uniref:MazG family protein n=1 Tax=Actinocorallia sp. A-T 12471 TaxID=3089813 RepID=UPI0029D14ADE|nr:MazG family protein [Actinocorallia sp. A-T 12471]MDX6738525.1 MazG family protein [Actinocorallia sp. A-T 12471]